MKHVAAIAMMAALALTASAAHAASNYYKRHARAPVVVAPAPSGGFGPARPMGPPDPYRCYQDEGYGRWSLCGQGH